MHRNRHWLLTLLLAAVVPSGLAAQNDIDRLLKLAKAPEGVVFEIVSGQDDALAWALPQVQQQAARLRARFPGLPIAVVSHGREQFALTEANRERYPAVHNRVRAIREQNIDIQVCGTHASWRNLNVEDFPAYVDVVSTAPSAIAKYREFGYELVVLRVPLNPRP